MSEHRCKIKNIQGLSFNYSIKRSWRREGISQRQWKGAANKVAGKQEYGVLEAEWRTNFNGRLIKKMSNATGRSSKIKIKNWLLDSNCWNPWGNSFSGIKINLSEFQKDKVGVWDHQHRQILGILL